jgi:hypothetical protein
MEELSIQKTFNGSAADGSAHPTANTPTGTVYIFPTSGAGSQQNDRHSTCLEAQYWLL